MEGALVRLVSLGIQPDVVFDVGAAEGNWMKLAGQYWPKSKYELIEPLEEQRAKLNELSKAKNNVDIHLAVAGSVKGEIEFSVSDDLDGSGVYGDGYFNKRTVPVITIDDIFGTSDVPCLIKLDTHGYEIPILEGSTRALGFAQALIIEVYGFQISPTAAIFHQLSSWLETKGFRLYDIVDVSRRPSDKAFWQADAVYLKETHPIFENNSYNQL